MTKSKICIVTAVPFTVEVFLTNHILLLSQFYDVSIVTNLDSGSVDFLPPNVKCFSIPIQRQISLLDDLYAIYLTTRLFNHEKYELVLSITPKAGLIAVLAGSFTLIPNRIHWFTGQVWASKVGIKRFFLKAPYLCIPLGFLSFEDKI